MRLLGRSRSLIKRFRFFFSYETARTYEKSLIIFFCYETTRTQDLLRFFMRLLVRTNNFFLL